MNQTPDLAARILVIDDEPQIRRFLEISLRSQGFVVDQAAGGREGLERLATRGANLVVLDLGLPEMDGFEVLHELRQWSRVPVIVLSVRASEADKVRALDGGANDYVTKPFGIQEFMARVRGLLRGGGARPEAQPVFDDGRLRIDLARRRVSLAASPLRLTRKEYDVLALLARHAGRVVTQQQLLREVWGPAHLADTHYLRIVVARIRQKFNAEMPGAGARYVQTEAGVGYRLAEDGGWPAGPDERT